MSDAQLAEVLALTHGQFPQQKQVVRTNTGADHFKSSA